MMESIEMEEINILRMVDRYLSGVGHGKGEQEGREKHW
jgi:hypothetical protein